MIRTTNPNDGGALEEISQDTCEAWQTKRQLAAHLGCSTRWIDLQHRKGLPSILIGSQRRYRRTAVEAWLIEAMGANDA